MGYNIGPKIGIDGESEFRKQIRNLNTAYKTLQAETRAVTAEFDRNGDAQGKLRATAGQLQKEIDNQRKRYDLLQDAVKKATDMFGEDSVEAQRLKGVLADTKATIAKLEKELDDTSAALDGAGDSMDELSEDTDKAEQSFASFGELVKANAIGNLIADGMRAAANAVKEFAIGSVETAANINAANSAYSQTFGNMQAAATSALQAISDETKIATTRMQAGYTAIYAFAKTTGSDAPQALDLASRAMRAAADTAAYYDTSVEEATERLQAFMKGNFANDAALGIACTETTRNTKANELYGLSFKDLAESQKTDVLLSMVEAGNAASGALGQAARESDGWENVTGELNESLRQLQGRVGQAALEKIGPTIQRITEKVYDLIERNDWDAFGKSVGNILDFVIEKGPQVVKTVGAITAGVATFKAAQKAKEVLTLAKSFSSLATAGVSAVTPWGLAATAIGGAVAMFTAFALNTEHVSEELTSGMAKFDSAMQSAQERYEEARSEAEGSAYAAEHYAQRLAELEEQGLDTAESQYEYKQIVGQLNDLVPGLSLQIDAQTGKLNKNTKAILAETAAWKKSAIEKALQEKYTAELEAQGEAYAELYEAELKMRGISEENGELLERRIEAEKALSQARQEYAAMEAGMSAAEKQSGVVLAQKAAEVSKLEQAYRSANAEYNRSTAQMTEMSGAIVNAKDTIAGYEQTLAEARDAAALYAESQQEITSAADLQRQAIAETQAAVDSLQSAYDEAKGKAHESLTQQIGLFAEIADKSDWSAEKIIKNWEKQQEAFANYEKNLQKAVDMGLDQTLVQQLSNGSQESMQILDAMVNDTDISIDEINEAFEKMTQGRESVENTMADLHSNFSAGMDELKEEAERGGMNIIDGLVTAIDKEMPRFSNSMDDLGRKGLGAFKQRMAIASPSKKMMEAGGYIVEGAAIGVDSAVREFEQSMSGLAMAGNDAFLQHRLDYAANYPTTGPVAAPSSTTVNHSYGGITIPVYAQPGQDPQQIAELVMDKLNQTIRREEDGLHG